MGTGGPVGSGRSTLLPNLPAPCVGASPGVMDRDARGQRGERPFVFTDLRRGPGVGQVVDCIAHEGMLGPAVA